MRLSQSVVYAIQAALRLGSEAVQAPVSCSQLAADGRMPERFLLQILRAMARQGILRASRGGGGGFRLERNPEEISLLDLIEAVDGPVLAGFPAKGEFPGTGADRLHEVLRSIAESTRRQLEAIRLSDLMVASPAGPVAVAITPLRVDPISGATVGSLSLTSTAIGTF